MKPGTAELPEVRFGSMVGGSLPTGQRTGHRQSLSPSEALIAIAHAIDAAKNGVHSGIERVLAGTEPHEVDVHLIGQGRDATKSEESRCPLNRVEQPKGLIKLPNIGWILFQSEDRLHETIELLRRLVDEETQKVLHLVGGQVGGTPSVAHRVAFTGSVVCRVTAFVLSIL